MNSCHGKNAGFFCTVFVDVEVDVDLDVGVDVGVGLFLKHPILKASKRTRKHTTGFHIMLDIIPIKGACSSGLCMIHL
jgi:hypothetical protein